MSAYALALDPGLNATGWALLHNGMLSACGLIRTTERTPLLRAEETVIALKRIVPYGEAVDLVGTLTEAEVEIYAAGLRMSPPSLRHNVADAVGIAAWWSNEKR